MKKIFLKLSLFITMLGIALPFLTSCGSSSDSNKLSFTLHKQMNSYIERCKANGFHQEILKKWYSLEGDKSVPFDELEGKNGTINVATAACYEPFCFIYNNKPVGLSLDYTYHFAKEYGYKVNIHDYSDVSRVIDSVVNGRDDIAAAPTSITEERKLSVAFSNSYYDNAVINVTLYKNRNVYNTKESLAGQNVGANSGSTNSLLVLRDIPTANLKEYPTMADLNMALRKGDIVSYYTDKSTFDYMILSETDLVETFTSDTNYYGFVFPKFGYQALSELENSTISVLEGSVYEQYINQKLPKAQKTYFKDISNCAQSLTNNKASAFAADYAIAREMNKELDGFYTLQESLGSNDVGAAFPKTTNGEINRDLFNNYLDEITTNGDLDKLKVKWLNYEKGTTKTEIPYDTLPNINGEFKLSVDSTITPFTFLDDNRMTGFEVELFYNFCEKNGFSLKIEQMNFDSLLASLSTNDAAASMILMTDERKQNANFSNTYYKSDVVLVCYSSAVNSKSFFEKIGDSFYKTFVKEERWKMFFQGIGNTLLICVCSALGGILIGTLLFMLCKDGNKLANVLAKIYNSVLHNIPVVVILMIFYYVIFGNAGIDGTIVSIIGFSFTFSTSIFGMLKAGVGAVDKQQFETSLALGYRKNQSFFKIILPQASRFFYPQFSADIVSLLKETAIVGYIAVMDLTKVSDVIRSRTYEAFFPLIATAIIYFILAMLLVYLVKLVQKLTDPRRRKRTTEVKGVNNHD